MLECPSCGGGPIRLGYLADPSADGLRTPGMKCDACGLLRALTEEDATFCAAVRANAFRTFAFFGVALAIWFVGSVGALALGPALGLSIFELAWIPMVGLVVVAVLVRTRARGALLR